jgi:tetratricopeptide (TPR) repeat protein
MPSPFLILSLLFAICLSLGSALQNWYQQWSGARNNSANILNALIGDSRQMFANHFFAKADAYFHSGYYPTIFDTQKKEDKSHLSGEHDEHHEEGTNHVEDAGEEASNFLGEPKDWIDRFSRNFFSSHHSHLEKNGDEREILPWLRLSAELDPQMVETYVTASYWLRNLGKIDEAEHFLREGMRANPDSYEIYFELGRIYDEDRHEPKMARNLWEVALRKWNADQKKMQAVDPDAKPDYLVYNEITGRLAKVEQEQGNLKEAIRYLELLKKQSPAPDEIQKQIEELQARLKSDSQK